MAYGENKPEGNRGRLTWENTKNRELFAPDWLSIKFCN